MIKIGEKVPEITVSGYQAGKEKKFNIRKLNGKWLVLAFYPADFTFVCPTELEELADLYNEFKKNGAEIMSVSTDRVEVHKAWHDASPSIKKIKYPMLSDPALKLCKTFGTYIEEEGLSHRGSFIIDPDGILKCVEMHDNSIGRSAKEILRKLKAGKFVRENKGLVCPASWEPGEKTLKPGLNLVGKI